MINIFMILVLIALPVVLIRGRGNPERTRIAVWGLVGLAALLLLIKGCGGRGTDRDAVNLAKGFFHASGFVTGQAVAQSIPPGSVILLLQPPAERETEGMGLMVALQREGVEAGLAGRGHLVLIEAVDLADPGAALDPERGYLIRHDALNRLISGRNDLAAIVLLQMEYVPGRGSREAVPPLYLVLPHERDKADLLLRHDEVAAVVTIRSDANWAATPSGRTRPADLFALRYELLTPR